MKCAITGRPYTVYGYKGKQVRDNLHSLDLVEAFWLVFQRPRVAEVYNMGGGRESHCSMLEAIALCEDLTGRKLNWSYRDDARIGDHIWWIGDLGRFKSHYPEWRVTRDVPAILREIRDELVARRLAHA
jgi:CDP-paratose 2-epimerase